MFDVRIGGDALRRDRRWWEGALAQCRFEGGKLSEIRLVPVDLGQQSSRSQQGRPFLAQGATAKKIIGDLIHLSAPFGTEIEFVDGMGKVRL